MSRLLVFLLFFAVATPMTNGLNPRKLDEGENKCGGCPCDKPCNPPSPPPPPPALPPPSPPPLKKPPSGYNRPPPPYSPVDHDDHGARFSSGFSLSIGGLFLTFLGIAFFLVKNIKSIKFLCRPFDKPYNPSFPSLSLPPTSPPTSPSTSPPPPSPSPSKKLLIHLHHHHCHHHNCPLPPYSGGEGGGDVVKMFPMLQNHNIYIYDWSTMGFVPR